MNNELRVVCSRCNGARYIEVVRDEEVRSSPCECLIRRMLLHFIGPELARAKHRKSALFMPTWDEETKETIGDRTLDNLFIKGAWPEVAAHLRWALAGKKHMSPGFTFRMVNDEKLVRVYVGDFAYSKRSTKVRDEIETYNNLSDLVFEQSLLIVRLGKLKWKNSAAARILWETLDIRASESRPTWLIEGELPFGEGHLMFDHEVGRYIKDNFEVIDLGGDVNAARATWAALIEIASGMQTEVEPAPDTKEHFVAEQGALEDLGKAYRSKKMRGKGRGNSGSGLPNL